MSQARDRAQPALLSGAYRTLGWLWLLGFADVIDSKVPDEVRGQKLVFWYSVICTVVALSIVICLVRVKLARAEMTINEKKTSQAEEKDKTLNPLFILQGRQH
jgi:hypothetical protein